MLPSKGTYFLKSLFRLYVCMCSELQYKMRLCVSSCGSPSKRVKNVGSGKHTGLGVGDTCTQILGCAVCPPAL